GLLACFVAIFTPSRSCADTAAATYARQNKSNHWSFIAPVRSAVPRVTSSGAKWRRNPIDNFVLARLDKEGIKPSPDADKITLIRRAALDTTGLPPRPEEVDAFLADDRPDAFERLVDRLL